MSRVSYHVAQGEFLIAGGENTVIAAVLGSCVAACLWDPVLGKGGMNHILLPEIGKRGIGTSCFAINAMELVVNGLLREGAKKERLQAKLFGGASMIASSSDIGRRNAEMATAFLEREGIAFIASSLGGERGRKVHFWPATGRVRQQFLPHRTMVEERRLIANPPAGDIELF